MTVPLSVLIPVKNEAHNLPECLDSVAFADDVRVIDSGSTDDTVAVAESRGAQVVQFLYTGGYPKKKNWALDALDWNHEWVLIVDADERVTSRLAGEIEATLARPAHPGYYIPRRFMFMGRWIKHCGYYPSHVIRLIKRGQGRYETPPVKGVDSAGDVEIHERVLLDGEAGVLENDFLHYAYPDIRTWIDKHNRYSSWWAEVGYDLLEAEEDVLRGGPLASSTHRKRWLRRMGRKLPFGATARFLYHYGLQLGVLDGYPGYVLCRLLAQGEFWSRVKATERRLKDADGP